MKFPHVNFARDMSKPSERKQVIMAPSLLGIAINCNADHVQMTALSRALKTNIRVAYLDGHSTDGTVNFVDFVNTPPEDSPDPPVLLYRFALWLLSIRTTFLTHV